MTQVRTLVVFVLLATALPWAGSHLVVAPAPNTASFVWPVFLIYAFPIVACVVPILWRLAKWRQTAPDKAVRHPFPWWGWGGLVISAVAWLLAWTRFDWFAPWQQYTFTPLWFGYVLTINALAFRNSGHCLLRDRPSRFIGLFPASAAFWWYFEYINRYVGNWHYVGVESLGSIAYFVHATISFSTVLPAVVGTTQWIGSYQRVQRSLADLWPVRFANSKPWAWTLLAFGAFGFVALGAWPRDFYAMVWLAPLLVLVSLQALARVPNPLSRLAHGDWRGIGVPALAALFCGFFWEMWNWQSLAHWEYSIPFVQRFLLFKMPLLGYAGYLPFGVACVVIADLVCGDVTKPVSSSNRD